MQPKFTHHLIQGPCQQNNEDVHAKIHAAIRKYDELLTLVKKRKLMCFGHISRYPGLAKTILQHCETKKKKKVDRKRGVKIILMYGQGWTLLAQLGQFKTGLGRR